MSTTPAITVSQLHKAFGSLNVLRGVDLTISSGESVVVIGGSGTGKSVLMKLILGLIKPDAGDITVMGKPPKSLAGEIGMLFQGGALFDSLRIWENISFQGRFSPKGKTLGKEEAYALAVERLTAVGLGADVADQYPSELSGGMQKRAALARAIAFDPPILFFDEPTTGLDPIRANQINHLIADIVKKMGASALTITHDMESAKHIADRILYLKDGQFVWEGTPDQLSQSDNEDLRAFIEPTTPDAMPKAMPKALGANG